MIAVIAACGANFNSVIFALERLGKSAILTIDEELIVKASHVILPGVGTAHQAMQQLEKYRLIDTIKHLQQPVLGICLGMQILFEYSTESDIACLGIIPGKIEALAKKSNMSLPHMGWNQLCIKQKNKLFDHIQPDPDVYYVHGYRAPVNEYTIATTAYTEVFAAAVQRDNFYGVQCHPERSSQAGAQILKNFVELV